MKLTIDNTSPEALEADALVLVLFEAEGEDSPGGRYNAITNGLIAEVYQTKDFRGKLGETVLLHRAHGVEAGRLAVAGGGKSRDFSPARLRQAAGAALRSLRTKGIERLGIVPAGDFGPALQAQAVAEGALLAAYEPDVYKTEDRQPTAIHEVVVLADAPSSALDRARAVAEAQNFTRELVNEPGNRLPPSALAARAAEMAAGAGLEIENLSQDRLEELGMGALLGVARGSEEPPVLIVVRYEPKDALEGVHLGLVGKAVTFDTGGISIKPAADMDRMKYDMAGGAAMLGAMKAIAALKPPVRVTAVIPSVENMPSGKALRPGDVLTSFSGKTIEVLNTDAEGRLILADALTYAQRQGCTHLVDAATLTGAIVVALGHERAGVFSNNDEWCERLLDCAGTAGEKMWRMPLDEEYKEQLKSSIADLPNIGSRWGGAITAAMFLKQFADPLPWVHLDIAGTAWLEENKPWMPKGPTGVGVRALAELAVRLGQ